MSQTQLMASYMRVFMVVEGDWTLKCEVHSDKLMVSYPRGPAKSRKGKF